MASTSQCLTWIELECHGWLREGPRGSRALFNEAHRLLLMGETEQNVLFDANIGDLPYFATHANQFSYNCPANVWKVGGVLIDYPEYYDYGYNTVLQDDWSYEECVVGAKPYYKVKNIRSWIATRGAVARIEFTRDPGESTETYRRFAWRLPTEITADTVQHEMPGSTDMELLVPATMRLIDGINDHDKYEAARQYIVQVLKPQLTSEMDSGEQGVPSFSKKRAY